MRQTEAKDSLTQIMATKIKFFIKYHTIAAFLVLLISGAVRAQEQPLKINYRLAMSHPSSHLFEISI